MLVGPALYFLSRWDTRLDPRPEPLSAADSELMTLPGQPRAQVDVDLVNVELRKAQATG